MQVDSSSVRNNGTMPTHAAALMIDNTPSAEKGHAVPSVQTDQVQLMIRQLLYGHGRSFRIEPVVEDARKVQPFILQLPDIPIPVRPLSPVNKYGDQDFYKEVDLYNSSLEQYLYDSSEVAHSINQFVDSVAQPISDYLQNYYSRPHHASDIRGALLNIKRYLEASSADVKALIAASDLQHDLPGTYNYDPPKPVFSTDVKLYQVTPNSSTDNVEILCSQKDALDSHSVCEMLQ
ncbi:MAG: hypothetical protein BGO69_16995 [Bacteroidetes bacterium 46-16]|nr:MAG: hypothetical protein BGO69_16995 [Bacteroidetes bacterium 46-16]